MEICMKYEVVALPMPKNAKEAESFEQYLEKASSNGAELVSIVPIAANPSAMMCIFRSSQKGAVDRSATTSF
jgi:hypothetical protein